MWVRRFTSSLLLQLLQLSLMTMTVMMMTMMIMAVVFSQVDVARGRLKLMASKYFEDGRRSQDFSCAGALSFFPQKLMTFC